MNRISKGKPSKTTKIDLATGPSLLASDAGAGVSDRMFALIVSLLTTALVFTPFLGQILNSGYLCFQYGGDYMRQSFPAFRQTWKIPLRYGVDIASFNGATEIALRANIDFQYPFSIIFSMLGRAIGFNAAHVLFYAAHMVVFLYCGILLAAKVFGMERKYACLFALSSLSVLFFTSWYPSFYVVAALTMPMAYSTLRLLKDFSILKCILTSFVYVCGFLSGYITVSVFECGFVLLLTILLGLTWRDDGISKRTVREVLIRSFAPFVLAGVAVVGYYLQVLIYTGQIVGKASSTLQFATALPYIPKDWLTILSNAFYPLNPIEMNYLPHFGWPWCLILALTFIFKEDTDRINRTKRGWIGFIAICFFALLLVTAGTNSSFAYWVYAIPVLGSMHLPMRYFMVVMPFAFLAGAAFLFYNKQLKPKSSILLTVLIALTGVGLCVLLFKRTYSDTSNENILVIELLMLFMCLVMYKKGGLTWPVIALIVLGATMFPLVQNFYGATLVEKQTYEAHSIVYSDTAMDTLNGFVDGLPDQDRYKFITLDINEAGQIPEYVPNNLAWYMDEGDTLSEYLGYELCLGTPKDYLNRMPWFDSIDWGYITDTRGDFVIVSPAMYEIKAEQLTAIIDSEYPTVTLPDGSVLYKLKKFIPSYYTGGERMEDAVGTLDNGYFYCPYLAQKDLLKFETNKTSRFSAVISSEAPNDIAFTLYPNRYYHYYVDGKEVEPTIYDMQAFIHIGAGEHRIEVSYRNHGLVVANVVFVCYYAVVCVVAAVIVGRALLKKKRAGKKPDLA